MMLERWVDKANRIARVTDNQRFAYEKFIRRFDEPVSYALRK